MKTHYRHGDLGIRPGEATAAKWEKCKELTLALGEATGHHHTLYPEPGTIVERMKGSGQIEYFRVRKGKALLKHQEHNTLTIFPGTYEITREREWDYFENDMKRVVD